MPLEQSDLLWPDWPAPVSVKAVTTTRRGGVSTGPYDSFNLANHVGDDPARVSRNRELLIQELALPSSPCWLQQVHSAIAVEANQDGRVVEADAVFSRTLGQVCVVMTADCLPVLFCDQVGSVVAAAHAGWRGLAGGVLEQTVSALGVVPDQLMAWLGPAIGPNVYEVGNEVYQAFVDQNPRNAGAFVTTRPGHWRMDIYQLARWRLQDMGLVNIHGGDFCTYTDRQRFYSYRRDGTTGRMATLIWLAEQ